VAKQRKKTAEDKKKSDRGRRNLAVPDQRDRDQSNKHTYAADQREKGSREKVRMEPMSKLSNQGERDVGGVLAIKTEKEDRRMLSQSEKLDRLANCGQKHC